MKYKTYLFDFDGTLVDSMPSYIAVMLRILDENNVAYGKDIIKIITPLGYLGTAKYYIEQLGLDMPVEEIVERMNRYAYDEYAYRIRAKEHVVETVKHLKDMGAELHVLTASPHRVLDVCLKRLGMYDLFTNVWSCDDFDTTKSDPEIYRMAAERIGKPVEEILFLDDNYNADKTAAAAGMKVCGVFDPSSQEYAEEIRQVSDHYIRDFSELLAL
jgi:HAD superfamily hydrolase (TIGR01509 family)